MSKIQRQVKAKALQILEKNKTIKERSDSFYTSIRRDLLEEFIHNLEKRVFELQDKIFEESDFSLETNLNSGLSALSREQTKNRFANIMSYEYELELVELELKAKRAVFTKYFGNE